MGCVLLWRLFGWFDFVSVCGCSCVCVIKKLVLCEVVLV